MNDFASLDTPGGSKGIKVVEIFIFENFFRCFLDVDAPGKKICFLQSLMSFLLFFMLKKSLRASETMSPLAVIKPKTMKND